MSEESPSDEEIVRQADARTLSIIDDLRALPAETEWAEFKENNPDPMMIGKLISALSNSARIEDQHFAYVVWGIQDITHSVVGTDFEPSTAKQQNQPLEMWLSQMLNPAVAFRFKSIQYQEQRIVLLEIPAASVTPVEFDRTAYLRIGSATPRLSDHPERQKLLWSKIQPYAWETGSADQYLASEDVLKKLDYTSYFELTEQPLPENREGIFEKLKADRLIEKDVGGRWNITNLGAVLFARKISELPPSVSRKAVRFVAYEGKNRASKVLHRLDGQKGYASGFQGLVDYIDGLLPKNEHIGKAFRQEETLFPSIAIRELIANALIHQDMTITGTGPLVELFQDRLEITNPGKPLVNPDRFLDSPPRSRNEALASLMRRMRLCEEQGTGIDKVLTSAELHQLPPPDFRVEGDAVRASLFAPRKFADMTQEERVRAAYQHAALKYVSGERMTNASLRERFGIAERNASQASGVIRQALDTNQIRSADPEHPRAGYVPYWA
tara:strand:- start:5432 stop:6925 length:1494 start_codon:yes stop_codon:yes gene_type:complete